MIIFHFNEIITCGAVLQTFGIVEELNKRGIEAYICSNHRNKELEFFYNIIPKKEKLLTKLTDNDIIVANWYEDIPKLEKYKGRKIQWIRTKDDEFNREAIKIRQRPGWEYISNSKYTGDWIKKPYTIIPNYVHPRFFEKTGGIIGRGEAVEYFAKKMEEAINTRDIDILIEGNAEKNKNIDETIKIAKQVGGKIVWFGRQTKKVEGVESISSPSQEDIPNLYRRSKIFLKLSHSEGFCNPILEAMASGCAIITKDMGGNDYCKNSDNCAFFREVEQLRIMRANLQDRVEFFNNDAKIAYNFFKKIDSYKKRNAYKTAKQHTIDNTINKFLNYINEN